MGVQTGSSILSKHTAPAVAESYCNFLLFCFLCHYVQSQATSGVNIKFKRQGAANIHKLDKTLHKSTDVLYTALNFVPIH